jgi:hypothetical protein
MSPAGDITIYESQLVCAVGLLSLSSFEPNSHIIQAALTACFH